MIVMKALFPFLISLTVVSFSCKGADSGDLGKKDAPSWDLVIGQDLPWIDLDDGMKDTSKADMPEDMEIQDEGTDQVFEITQDTPTMESDDSPADIPLETCPDGDGDGACDGDDNCEGIHNPDQADNDGDGLGNLCDNCPEDYNPLQGDGDLDQVGDICDNCLDVENPAQGDVDGDSLGDECDDDADNDGLTNEEEKTMGEDCSLTNPLDDDTDDDGVLDTQDPYPADPFPPFILLENDEGTITVVLTDGLGGFLAPFEVGSDLGYTCAAQDSNCSPGCGIETHCEFGKCVADNLPDCGGSCPAGLTCRHLVYRGLSIADFDNDGVMDFIAHSAPKKEDGTHGVWFFYRFSGAGSFPQQLLGSVDDPMAGVVADLDGNNLFDLVTWEIIKPANISEAWINVYLRGPYFQDAPCLVGSEGQNCAFTKFEKAVDLTGIAGGQWSLMYSREAQDLTGDGLNDLVCGTISSGAAVDTKMYLLENNGDGTFKPPVKKLDHPGSKGPANSIVFADFDNDGTGDMVLGLDDDGDAGSAWLYKGLGAGNFEQSSTKVFDLNTDCNSGCSDRQGVCGNAKAFDMDFDGNMDIILGYMLCPAGNPGCDIFDSAKDSMLVIFRGNGNGTFKELEEILFFSNSMEAVRFQIPQRLCPWYEY